MLLTFATGVQWRGTGESCEESLKKKYLENRKLGAKK